MDIYKLNGASVARIRVTQRFSRKAIGVITAILALGSTNASASTADPGYIRNITPLNSALIFYHDGGRSQPPACATERGRFAFDDRSPDGQAKLLVLLTAYSFQKKVTVFGSGSCIAWRETETMDYMIVQDG